MISCKVPGCLSVARAKGVCKKHEHQIRSHGSPRTPWTRERDFWSKVDKRGPDECWPWRRRIGTRGYGQVTIGGKKFGAHTVAYRYSHGPIPGGMEVDHRCHDPRQCSGGRTCPHRRCCNPAHLRAVSRAENSSPERSSRELLAALHRSITHCPSGHEYTPENTHVDQRGWRNCRKCRRISQAAGRKKKRSIIQSTVTADGWLVTDEVHVWPEGLLEELSTDAYQDP